MRSDATNTGPASSGGGLARCANVNASIEAQVQRRAWRQRKGAGAQRCAAAATRRQHRARRRQRRAPRWRHLRRQGRGRARAQGGRGRQSRCSREGAGCQWPRRKGSSGVIAALLKTLEVVRGLRGGGSGCSSGSNSSSSGLCSSSSAALALGAGGLRRPLRTGDPCAACPQA